MAKGIDGIRIEPGEENLKLILLKLQEAQLNRYIAGENFSYEKIATEVRACIREFLGTESGKHMPKSAKRKCEIIAGIIWQFVKSKGYEVKMQSVNRNAEM